ncbi:MAG TPA: hypothetical protein VIY51_28885 [Xanthobacteraceae bacterium]
MPGLRVIWFILATAMLAWPAWQAWRWELARRVYVDEQETPVPAITAKHVEALRKLQFAWDTRIESGGPVVDPQAPYGSNDMASDLGAIIGTRDRLAVARFHREVSAILIWALGNREIAEGAYRLAHLNNAAMEQRLRRDLAGLPPERIESIVSGMPRLAADGYFRFTDQHRRLLRELRFEWPDPQIIWIVAAGGYPAPAVHFKRPFGDMTAFEIDMAAILGLPNPKGGPVDPVLDRLYWEMWPALQTFVEHVAIDATAPAPNAK